MNQHLTKFDEITMTFVVDFDRSPRIGSSSDFAAIRSHDEGISTDDGEGDFAL